MSENEKLTWGVNKVWHEDHGAHQVFTDIKIDNIGNVDTILQ